MSKITTRLRRRRERLVSPATDARNRLVMGVMRPLIERRYGHEPWASKDDLSFWIEWLQWISAAASLEAMGVELEFPRSYEMNRRITAPVRNLISMLEEQKQTSNRRAGRPKDDFSQERLKETIAASRYIFINMLGLNKKQATGKVYDAISDISTVTEDTSARYTAPDDFILDTMRKTILFSFGVTGRNKLLPHSEPEGEHTKYFHELVSKSSTSDLIKLWPDCHNKAQRDNCTDYLLSLLRNAAEYIRHKR